MAWARIHLRCEPAAPGHEIATAWLADAGCSMFEEVADGLHAFAKKEELDTDLADVIQADLVPLGLKTWLLSEVEEENWNAKWESDYPEVTIGDSIRVKAPFHPDDTQQKFDVTLTVQPRMAFGTGHHGTTFGILAEMVGMDWLGTTVLDMGCGSGVLGIYAATRGSREVVAVDIDPWSVRNTRENLALNGIREDASFEVREGGADQLIGLQESRFDVVIANINRNILLEDMDAYCRVLGASGTLILSGFMEPDIRTLVDAAGQHGLRLDATRSESEWRILTLRR